MEILDGTKLNSGGAFSCQKAGVHVGSSGASCAARSGKEESPSAFWQKNAIDFGSIAICFCYL